ncbi:MAG: sulfatase [Cyclobacteriaceae bacterium]
MNTLKTIIPGMILSIVLLSCQETVTQVETTKSPPPNILWLVAEDLSPILPPFGDSTIVTPNISRLAAEGVRYTHLFSTSGVCAPSRAAIATGMYPSSIGANHMRTSSYPEVTGLPVYEAIPPAEVKMMSQILRENGYYCTNNSKNDYQFKAPNTAWNENGNYAHWRNRKEDQPFFAIFNFNTTHESGLFEPYGYKKNEMRHYQAGDTSFKASEWNDRVTEENMPKHVAKDIDFPIPPYLPDNEIVRRDMWKVYNNIAEMDRQVGAILKQLEADGLLENTIIFFYGDHGGPMPRQKRLIYESGLKSPLIVRYPDEKGKMEIDPQLISFVDFAPTVLNLAGIPVPTYLQGQDFMDDNQRTYVHAAADRFDGFTDAIRAVRDDRFRLIKNYRPEQGYYLPVEYRERIPTMQELLKMRDAGTLNEIQAQWFRESKPEYELFDLENDPHELNNLIDDPTYSDRVEQLKVELDKWLEDIGDVPNLPERQLIENLWNGEEAQPKTADPILTVNASTVTITCNTAGANIGYKLIDNDGNELKEWSIYTDPVELAPGEKIKVIAHRIGYQRSNEILQEI